MATDQSTVLFRAVPDFPGYRVGNDGSVWTCWVRHYPKGRSGAGVRYVIGEQWERMRPRPVEGGYLAVQLRRDGRGHHRFVHRLVLEAFVGPCPEGMEGCHEDGDPANNTLKNVDWKTKPENQADRVRHGTDNRGEKHGTATLTDAQVIALLPRLVAGECRAKVAREVGVSATVISKIACGKSYRHLRRPVTNESQEAT